MPLRQQRETLRAKPEMSWKIRKPGERRVCNLSDRNRTLPRIAGFRSEVDHAPPTAARNAAREAGNELEDQEAGRTEGLQPLRSEPHSAEDCRLQIGSRSCPSDSSAKRCARSRK